MIRKKRITTQVDLFVPEEVLTPDPSLSEPKESAFPYGTITVTRGFQNPILMGALDEVASTQDTTGSRAAEFVLPAEKNDADEREEIELPVIKPKETTGFNKAMRSDRESLIINRDFSDGFYLNENQKKNYEEKIEFEEEQLRKAIRHKRLLKTATVVLLAFAALLLWNWQDWVVNSSFFTLKNVYVQGSIMSSKSEILKLADLETGVRLAEVDIAKTAERIKANPIFKTVVVSRNYPSSIVIHVTERQPFAFVLLDELYAVDNSGFVLPKLKAKMIYNLPIISGANFVATPGKKINSIQAMSALKFLEKAKQLDESVYYEISEVNLTKEGMLAYLNTLQSTVRIDENNPERTVIYLGAAIPYFKQNENTDKIREIDLRYEGQILIKN